MFIYTFIIQAVLACILITWAIGKRKAFDRVPQEIHDKYPAFKRDDIKTWSIARFYFCGIFLLFVRFFVAFGFFTVFCLITMFLTRNHDLSKPVPDAIRRKCQFFARWMCRVFLFAVGFMWINEEDVDVDYTEYLGKDYDKTERPCTIVANHTSWVDIILFMYCKYFPSFVSKDGLKKVPLVKTVAAMLN